MPAHHKEKIMKIEELAKLLMNKDKWIHSDKIIYSSSPTILGTVYVGVVIRTSRIKSTAQSLRYTHSFRQLNRHNLKLLEDTSIKVHFAPHGFKITNAWSSKKLLLDLVNTYAYDPKEFAPPKNEIQIIFNRYLEKKKFKFNFDFKGTVKRKEKAITSKRNVSLDNLNVKIIK